MNKRIIDSLGYLFFVIVMGFATYLALQWTEQSQVARLIYEGL
ncbi:MAG: hypothetical protein V4598_17385 [Bdellovibrionota bacterium]